VRTITGRVAIGVSAFLVLLAIIAGQTIYGVSITAKAVSYLARTALPQAALYEQFDLQVSHVFADLTGVLYSRSIVDLIGVDRQPAHHDTARAAR
jgi:hypothetical protein